jgi:hypothetical protein
MNDNSNVPTINSATNTVRWKGTAIPAYFLGRPRDRWTAAMTPSTDQLASAA